MICRTCEDKGLIGGCPVCHKVFNSVKLKKVEVTTETLDSKSIPKDYLGVVWDKEKLIANHQMYIENTQFKFLINQLDRMTEIFKRGEIPNQSVIIIAPRSMSKVTFAFSCMQLAISNGYSVCPLLDNTQIKRINRLSSDNPTSWCLKNYPTIEEVLTADVLFMTVDNDNYATALRTIESIMEKRSRLDKATFVLTRYSLDKMSQFEKHDEYETLMDRTRSFNNKKYPIIINCLV